MKTRMLLMILLIATVSFALAQKQPNPVRKPVAQGVDYTVVQLSEQETARITGQGESARLSRQIEGAGYQSGKTETAAKFVGKDDVGAFEIIVIERSYAPTARGKSAFSTYYYEARRGKSTVGSRLVAFDDEAEYKAGASKLEKTASSAKLSDCYPKFIASYSSCSSMASSIKSCINGCPKNNKGKPKFFCVVGCVLSNAKKISGCVKNVIGLTNCIIDNS